jgi:hypothetical protein
VPILEIPYSTGQFYSEKREKRIHQAGFNPSGRGNDKAVFQDDPSAVRKIMPLPAARGKTSKVTGETFKRMV